MRTGPQGHELSSHQEQIAEGEQRTELRPVLGRTFVAGLHMAGHVVFDSFQPRTRVIEVN
jgi:hypothetical protein